MRERAPSTSRVPEAPRAPERLRTPVAAGVLAMIASLSMGCFDIVSLGEGPPQAQDSAEPPFPRIPVPTAPGDTDPLPENGQCTPGPQTDNDGDGFTPEEGDCDDCDPEIGPSAVELPTEEGEFAADEDCDGHIDEPAPTCDDGLAIGELSPYAAARALDLCQMANKGLWGVISAAWVLPDGSPPPAGAKFDLGHGILPDFGPYMTVRGGHRLLALSTGVARLPEDPDFIDLRGFDKGYTSKPLGGSGGGTSTCPAAVAGPPHDAIALEIALRTPQNAESIAFDFDFYSYEFPEQLCTEHDDLFVALLNPAVPANLGANIAFDALGNRVSVNSVRFEACQCTSGPPCLYQGIAYGCPLGATPLAGTGFGASLPTDTDHGATGWLVAESRVAPRSTIRLRFAVQDAADGSNDSTVLLDHVRFQRAPAEIPSASHATH